MIGAWEVAKLIFESDRKIRVLAAASGGTIPVPISDKDYSIMEAAFLDIHGQVTESKRPGKPMMSVRLKEIIDGGAAGRATFKSGL